MNHNLTEFENVMYRQTKGTAMGPKNACAYADVAMNAIDQLHMPRVVGPVATLPGVGAANVLTKSPRLF